MRQDGSGRKKLFKCRLTCGVKGSELAIDTQAGPVGRVPPQIQKPLAVPLFPPLRLINRKIEKGLPNPVPNRPQAVGPETPRCQNDPFSLDPLLTGTLAHAQKKVPVGGFLPGKNPFRKKQPDATLCQSFCENLI